MDSSLAVKIPPSSMFRENIPGLTYYPFISPKEWKTTNGKYIPKGWW